VKRFGIFGGAFDPPHRAHRVLAETALAQLALDVLFVLPTGQAWHKNHPLTPATHRLAMARLAFADLPQVQVDDRETRRSGPTYTYDTLLALQQDHLNAQWFLVIGADQAAAFTSWHRWQDILQLASLVVAERPADAQSATGAVSLQWHNALPVDVQRLAMPMLAVSATQIRQNFAHDVQTATWLDPKVADYIRQHHLYTAAP